MENNITPKIAVIFGAANGLGRAIAERLALAGYHLIIIDKDLKKLESLDDLIKENGGTATIVQLDLLETAKIFELAEIIYKKFKSLDILISTAAILGELSPLDHFNSKTWDKVINVNLNANAHIIKAFHPLLKMTPASQAIFTTCSIAEENKAYWGAYSVSKAGLNNLVKIYANENKKFGIKIALFDPGEIATQIRYQAMPGLDQAKITSAEKVADFFVKSLTNGSFKHGDILQYHQ